MSSHPTKQYFQTPLSSLQISRLGAPDDTEKIISETLGKTSLGIDAFHTSGITKNSRNIGGGGKFSHFGVPLPQNLSPHLPNELNEDGPLNTLSGKPQLKTFIIRVKNWSKSYFIKFSL